MSREKCIGPGCECESNADWHDVRVAYHIPARTVIYRLHGEAHDDWSWFVTTRAATFTDTDIYKTQLTENGDTGYFFLLPETAAPYVQIYVLQSRMQIQKK